MKMCYNRDVTDIVEWKPSYPYIPDNQKKHMFLDFRISGHEAQETIALVGISERTYYHWKNTDPDFDYWNGTGLEQLRREQREKLVGNAFLINANLVQQMDRVFLVKMHLKSNSGEKFTDAERKTLDRLRSVYAMPGQMKAVREMVEVGKPSKGGMSIMEYFAKKDQGGQVTIIDGEFKEVPDDVPRMQSPDDGEQETS